MDDNGKCDKPFDESRGNTCGQAIKASGYNDFWNLNGMCMTFYLLILRIFLC